MLALSLATALADVRTLTEQRPRIVMRRSLLHLYMTPVLDDGPELTCPFSEGPDAISLRDAFISLYTVIVEPVQVNIIILDSPLISLV